MKEIGGYIELDKYCLPMLHKGAVALNCGRNALAYLIRAKSIKKILLPKFLCSSVKAVCEKEDVKVRYYSITADFIPKDITLGKDEWLYLVNYYGQLDNEKIQLLSEQYNRIIVDNAQAYFQMPINGIDTLYTCRKFLGVVDGAFLYTDTKISEALPIDESFERMRFLLGRFERSASEFYGEYVANNHLFVDEPIKRMSKLTHNLLHAIDYEAVKEKRTSNFTVLHEAFEKSNKLKVSVPEGAFMYPLYLKNGVEIRKKLQAKKIFVPMLWPDVFECCGEAELEYDMAKNILPLPIDQRYDKNDMKYIIEQIRSIGW